MSRSEALPSAEALEEVRRLAGSLAEVVAVSRLEGGQHALGARGAVSLATDRRLAGGVDPWRLLGWCRLDLVLLYEARIADDFLAAYEAASGEAVGNVRLWDRWAVARSEDGVAFWVPNYLQLGRADLDQAELRRRHAQWTATVSR